MLIVPAFTTDDTTLEAKAKIAGLVDYWLGDDATAGAQTWGDIRALLNAVPGPTFADRALDSVVFDALTSKNSSPLGNDDGLLLDFASDRYFLRDSAGVVEGAASDFVDLQRLSGGSYFDRNGIWQIAGNNVMRFDHDPATGESLGVLVEPQATNVLRQSVDMTTPPWQWSGGGGDRSIVAGDASAMGGNLWLIDLGSGNGEMRQTFVIPANVTTTVTVSVKRGSQPLAGLQYTRSGGTVSQTMNFIYDFDTDTLTPGGNAIGIIATRAMLGNGEVRVSLSSLASNGSTSGFMQVHRKGAGFFSPGETAQYGHIQVEHLPLATSYIPTTTVQVTRAADNIALPIADFPWNGGSGTLTFNGSAVTPILNGASDALDIAAMVAAAGATHLKTLTWVPS